VSSYLSVSKKDKDLEDCGFSSAADISFGIFAAMAPSFSGIYKKFLYR